MNLRQLKSSYLLFKGVEAQKQRCQDVLSVQGSTLTLIILCRTILLGVSSELKHFRPLLLQMFEIDSPTQVSRPGLKSQADQRLQNAVWRQIGHVCILDWQSERAIRLIQLGGEDTEKIVESQSHECLSG